MSGEFSMLSRWLDRVASPTIACGLVATLLWQFRQISAIFIFPLLAACTARWIYVVIDSTIKERKIDALGKRAYAWRTFSPWNVYMIYDILRHFSQHRNHDFWWKVFGKAQGYTIEACMITTRIIFTSDEENIKAILATQFSDYGKGEKFNEEWREFLGNSIFTTDGHLWHNSRSLLRPQFIKDRVSDLHTFEKHVHILLHLLTGSSNGATVRVDDLFFRFTLDASTDFLLGRSVDSLPNGQTAFATAFQEVQHTQSVIARTGPLRALVPRKQFRRNLKILDTFIGSYIDQALALTQDELEKKSKSDEGYTFLHALASYTRDRQVLRDQLMAVLLAGRDTTAVTLSWLFYELSRHPQVVEKLRQEIANFVGFDRHPTYADLKSMRYLQHTLNETLRLYPVVPYNVRVALKDTTLPRGGGPNGDQPIGVLKDTPVGYSTLILQRRPDIYPTKGFPDPLAFVPERWDGWTPTPWTYIPFNGGPRICIGQQFALTEIAYTAARILQVFETIECRTEEFPKMRTDIVLQPALGVYVGLFQRS